MLGFKIPEQLETLFKEFSKELAFDYQFENEFKKPYHGIFAGGLNWSLDRLYSMYLDYIGWTEAWLDPEMEFEPEEFERQEKIVLNKIPLEEVANGDLIVMDLTNNQVTYLSHEDDYLHGKILGNDLFEYLDFRQSIWFAGNEDWQFEPFFNNELECMEKEGENAKIWCELLENGVH